MARMLRWTLLTGVLAVGALVGPLGSKAEADWFVPSHLGTVGYGWTGSSLFPLYNWGWGYNGWGWGYPFAPYGGFYGGYATGAYGGYYPFFDGVLPYPAYTYALYPMWSYVPSSANAPYPKVIEVRRHAPAHATDAAPRAAAPVPARDEPAVPARRTVVYRANLNSRTPAGQPDQGGRTVVLGANSR